MQTLDDATINNMLLNQISHTKYANISALTFTTYKNRDITKFIVLQEVNQIYKFVSSFQRDNYNVETFDKIVNSIKFFD